MIKHNLFIFYKNIRISQYLAFILLFAFVNAALCDESTDFKDIVVSRIKLINHIISNPEAANMKNWVALGNPHDESELLFYMNSISNGALLAYNKKEVTSQKMIEHSRSISKDEPSVLLQYLRLTLMASNKRPGIIPSAFNIVRLNQPNLNEIVASCFFFSTNTSGVRVKKPAKIYWGIRSTTNKDIFLQEITIDGRVVYGWWYGENGN